MNEVVNVINRLTDDLRTIGLALLVLVLFLELVLFLFPSLRLPRIGIAGVLLVAVGFVVLPSVVQYLTSL